MSSNEVNMLGVFVCGFCIGTMFICGYVFILERALDFHFKKNRNEINKKGEDAE